MGQISPERRRRALMLLAITVLGMSCGIAADFLAPDFSTDATGVLSALILSPVAVTVGGGALEAGRASGAFLLGGIAFWPVFIVVARHAVRSGPWWGWFVLFAWTVQGYFQVVHRFEMLMSA